VLGAPVALAGAARHERIRIAFAPVTRGGSSRLVVCHRRGTSAKAGVVVHDPDGSKPHDLDDPFFDKDVRDRVGATIADAARRK